MFPWVWSLELLIYELLTAKMLNDLICSIFTINCGELLDFRYIYSFINKTGHRQDLHWVHASYDAFLFREHVLRKFSFLDTSSRKFQNNFKNPNFKYLLALTLLHFVHKLTRIGVDRSCLGSQRYRYFSVCLPLLAHN